MSAATFRQLLLDGDVSGIMAAWGTFAPGMPQPESRDHAEAAMHMARTSTESLPIRPRAYSHRWLTERDLPSQLPDRLKPSAERMFPVVVDAVGISVNAKNPFFKPAMLEVRGAMEAAVEDAYAEGRKEPVFVRARMNEARDLTYRKLFGVQFGEAIA